MPNGLCSLATNEEISERLFIAGKLVDLEPSPIFVFFSAYYLYHKLGRTKKDFVRNLKDRYLKFQPIFHKYLGEYRIDYVVLDKTNKLAENHLKEFGYVEFESFQFKIYRISLEAQ